MERRDFIKLGLAAPLIRPFKIIESEAWKAKETAMEELDEFYHLCNRMPLLAGRFRYYKELPSKQASQEIAEILPRLRTLHTRLDRESIEHHRAKKEGLQTHHRPPDLRIVE